MSFTDDSFTRHILTGFEEDDFNHVLVLDDAWLEQEVPNKLDEYHNGRLTNKEWKQIGDNFKSNLVNGVCFQDGRSVVLIDFEQYEKALETAYPEEMEVHRAVMRMKEEVRAKAEARYNEKYGKAR